MSTETPGREWYFWFDCETGGLDPFRDTVIEVAWCFTDENLRMVSPLRQRFTKVMAKPTGRDGRRAADQGHMLLDPSDLDRWHDNAYISPVARKMHEDSGLFTAWWDANDVHPRTVLTDPRDLVRLVAEDMDLANIGKRDRLVLAGAGVSHFDDSVLAEAFSGLYPRRPVISGGISPLGDWHYRCFDTSVAMWVAGPGARAAVDRVLTKASAPQDPDRDEYVVPFDLIECEQRVDDEAIHLLNFGPTGAGPGQFERGAAVAHRAADDVVWSLLDARALRYVVSRASL